jgi:hypothetical protein
MKKGFDAQCFCGQQGRSAGKSAHTKRQLRPLFPEKLSRGAKGADKSKNKSRFAAAYEAHRRERNHFHSRGRANRFLIHLFVGNQQGDGASALHQFFGDCKSWEQMATSAAASDRDAREMPRGECALPK